MAKKKRVEQGTPIRQELTPSRHNIAKQSAAVLALGLGLAAGGTAEASIVYTYANQTINNGDPNIDFLNLFGTNQFTVFLGGEIAQIGFYPGSVASYISLNPSLYPYWFAARLPKGTSIPTPNYQQYGYMVLYGTGDWSGGKKGYAGLYFSDGVNMFSGWAQVSVAADLNSLTLIDYAYESEANMPIEAGAVPLPGSLVMLASGAAGLLAYRRIKRAA